MRSVKMRQPPIHFSKDKMRIVLIICLTAVLAVVSLPQLKVQPPPELKIPFAESLQLLLVTTAGWNENEGKAQMFERSSPGARWKAKGKDFAVVIGINGSAWDRESSPKSATKFKVEGDGRSPAGLFPLKFAFGFAAKPEGLKFSYIKIEEGAECIDDAASSHYNKIADRYKVGNFDWRSGEKIFELGHENPLGVFVAYNSFPIRSGNGSCIFLRVWKNADMPTKGSTAMRRSDLENIVSWLDPNANPYFALFPIADYKKLRQGWSLPVLK